MAKCGAKTEIYSRVCGYFRPVSNWNKGKKEEFKQRKNFKIPASVLVLFSALFLSACSHNTSSFTVGTRLNAGLDPQNVTANFSYVDGLNVVDVSRENSSWDLEIDSENGVSIENGKVNGVKRIRREVGPQITGYLVDLIDKNPDLAADYVKAMKSYWEYRAKAIPAESK